jgi:hypothetical protein
MFQQVLKTPVTIFLSQHSRAGVKYFHPSHTDFKRNPFFLFLLWAALLQLPSYGTVLKKGLEKKK